MLQRVQQSNVTDAIKLFTDTQVAFAECEANGIKIDEEYITRTIEETKQRIQDISDRIWASPVGQRWILMYPRQHALTNRRQLGEVLFDGPKGRSFRFKCESRTETGLPQISESTLERIPELEEVSPGFAKDYSLFMSLSKMLTTNLEDIKDGMDPNGFLHSSFSLFSVISYRTSCVMEGTPILVYKDGNREYKKIEDITSDDEVWCYDDKLNLTHKKVIWAGKTGVKPVIGLIAYSKGFTETSGTLWVTPEHLIRMADGAYVEARRASKYVSAKCKKGTVLSVFGEAFRLSSEVQELQEKQNVYDLIVEDYHNFIANGICVHNSSGPNFQNFPNHNPELAGVVRRCFIPRGPDRHLVELDYSGAEVRANASINHDPTLLGSVNHGVDFHKAVAAKAYLLNESQVTKKLRQSVKGLFTFAAFYGSYWVAIAKSLWDQLYYGDLALGDGTPLLEHLRSKGITELGDVKNPKPGTYYYHIKCAEDWFWGEQFKIYARWKEKTWKQYQEDGYVDLPTGFRCAGIFTRNMVTNFPAQGGAAHCLLWSFCRLNEEIKKRGMETKICGQIHDSILLDIPHNELDEVLVLANDIMTKRLREAMPWIAVKMEIEADVAPEGKSWWDKKAYPIPGVE